jgi:hypothetical protein
MLTTNSYCSLSPYAVKKCYHSVLFVRINIAVHIHDGNQSPAERIDKLGDMLILSVFRSQCINEVGKHRLDRLKCNM